MPRADGPFEVLKKINENAYKLDLPADFGVSPTFNIAATTDRNETELHSRRRHSDSRTADCDGHPDQV
jgi:hypothetical protein